MQNSNPPSSVILSNIQEAIQFLGIKTDFVPEAGIILGTGLGGLAKEINAVAEISYAEIPHFPVSTVESHPGKLIFGTLNGKKIVAMQGRFHFYEGYSLAEVVFPVRVMKALGIKTLLVSNASGGLNPAYAVGDLMLIRDHINLLPDSPLRGKNEDSLGPRFPDMSDVYNAQLLQKAAQIAAENSITAHSGIYASVMGPCLETPAEYRYLRIIGGDAVGMSTVPEIIAAHHMGLKCFAVSIITDLGVEGKIRKVSLQDVIAAANKAEPKMTLILKALMPFA